MKIGHIELFVRDPGISKKFYTETLGFKLVEEQGNGNFVWVSSGEIIILLRPGKSTDKATAYDSSASGIVIYTENLDETRKVLISRGLKFGGTDGSDRCLTFTDPDGHWFQLVNPGEH